jgi:hypothetical protein
MNVFTQSADRWREAPALWRRFSSKLRTDSGGTIAAVTAPSGPLL